MEVNSKNDVIILYPECASHYLVGSILECFEKRKFKYVRSKQALATKQKLSKVFKEKVKKNPSFKNCICKNMMEEVQKNYFYLIELDPIHADSDAETVIKNIQDKFDIFRSDQGKHCPLVELINQEDENLYNTWLEVFK